MGDKGGTRSGCVEDAPQLLQTNEPSLSHSQSGEDGEEPQLSTVYDRVTDSVEVWMVLEAIPELPPSLHHPASSTRLFPSALCRCSLGNAARREPQPFTLPLFVLKGSDLWHLTTLLYPGKPGKIPRNVCSTYSKLPTKISPSQLLHYTLTSGR